MQRSYLKWFLLIFCLETVSLASADWPLFRGDPELRGVTTNSLPNKMSLLWNFKTKAPIRSSPIVAQNLVFIGSGDSNLYALDFSTGQKIWSYQADSPVDAPPLFVDGTVFVGSVGGWFYALEAA